MFVKCPRLNGCSPGAPGAPGPGGWGGCRFKRRPWWYASDVCRVLEIQNPTQALTRLDEDEQNTLCSKEGGTIYRAVNDRARSWRSGVHLGWPVGGVHLEHLEHLAPSSRCSMESRARAHFGPGWYTLNTLNTCGGRPRPQGPELDARRCILADLGRGARSPDGHSPGHFWRMDGGRAPF
jgi:hypothetical protein